MSPFKDLESVSCGRSRHRRSPVGPGRTIDTEQDRIGIYSWPLAAVCGSLSGDTRGRARVAGRAENALARSGVLVPVMKRATHGLVLVVRAGRGGGGPGRPG